MDKTIKVVDIEAFIRKNLNPERYRHSVGVMETAEKLAKHYGEDVEKAALAGILHDCGKNCAGKDPVNRLLAIGYPVSEMERLDPELLHGHIGALIASEIFDIQDEGILSAVSWHTTGKLGMSPLDKIIYIADYIEPNRDFEWVHPIRSAAYEDMDKCLVMCADCTLTFVMKKGKPIHPATVAMRNEILLQAGGTKR